MSSSKKSKKSVGLSPEIIAAREAIHRAQVVMFERFKAGDRSTPYLQSIQAIVEGVNDLRTRITAAKTIDEFQACNDIADTTLYDKASRIEWIDPMACFFITDTRTWCREAIAWIKWNAENPDLAAANLITDEIANPPGINTRSVEEAREWALRALASFESSMM